MRTVEVVRLSGASYRQVNYWATLGILPGQPRSPGNGQPRVWSTADAHRIRLVAAAVRAGMGPTYALRLAADLSDAAAITSQGLSLRAAS